MSSEYDMAKDVVLTNNRVDELTALVEQLYKIVEHNIKKGKIEEPKPVKP